MSRDNSMDGYLIIGLLIYAYNGPKLKKGNWWKKNRIPGVVAYIWITDY